MASLAVICSGLVLAALPSFMVGGLAVQIKDDLGANETAFGAAVTAGFIAAALSAPFGGRIADRLGARRAILIGSSISGLSLMGLGLVVDDVTTLVAFLALGGLAVAFIDPALAVLVGQTVTPSRHGLAFGVKEASIPASTLLAGLAVPAIALTVGWRWAFALGLVPFLLVVLLLPRLSLSYAPRKVDETSKSHAPPSRRLPITVASIAATLGIAAASGVGIFLTDSAVAMGVEPGQAGILLAVGSIAGVAARIWSGWLADRRRGLQFGLIASMLAVGAAAMAIGGTANTALLVVATVGVFTGGWAWTGLFFLSLVRTNPNAPGAAAGIGTGGLSLGNAIGPVLFGFAAGSVGYGTAWLLAGGAALVAAALMAWAARMFEVK